MLWLHVVVVQTAPRGLQAALTPGGARANAKLLLLFLKTFSPSYGHIGLTGARPAREVRGRGRLTLARPLARPGSGAVCGVIRRTRTRLHLKRRPTDSSSPRQGPRLLGLRSLSSINLELAQLAQLTAPRAVHPSHGPDLGLQHDFLVGSHPGPRGPPGPEALQLAAV